MRLVQDVAVLCGLMWAASAVGCNSGSPPRDERAAGSRTATASQFEARLAAGRELEHAKKWAAAQVELEAAVAERPTDQIALTELGWAAYHAGDLERARSASTLAVEAATDTKVKAMALYNLGLSIERIDSHAALSLFRESLNLRENRTVKAAVTRLVKQRGPSTVEGDALLERLHVLPVADNRPKPTSADGALIEALEAAGYEWE